MVGAKLKKMRTAAGLSQTELGKRAGVSYVQIGRYEKDINRPSSKVIKKLADALEVETDIFFGSTNEDDLDPGDVNKKFEKLMDLVQGDSEELNFLGKLLDDLTYKKEVRSLG